MKSNQKKPIYTLIVILSIQVVFASVIKSSFVQTDRKNESILKAIEEEKMISNKLKIQITAYQNQDVIRKMMTKYLPEYHMIKPTNIITTDEI